MTDNYTLDEIKHNIHILNIEKDIRKNFSLPANVILLDDSFVKIKEFIVE